MTIIQNHTIVNKATADVYQFLNDLNNHESLMPDNITNWSSTVDEARFTIKGMTNLALKVDQRVENQEIVCVPSEKAPFEVSLAWKIEEVSANETKATFVIAAELNMMMKMMASGPLQRLVDHQVAKLKEKLG